MKSFTGFLFGLYLAILFCMDSATVYSCPSPDVPEGGDYFPKQREFLVGDTITYNCTEGIILFDKTSTCLPNGHWSNRVLFCDRKAHLNNLHFVNENGRRVSPPPNLTDGNLTTCYTMVQSETVEVNVDEETPVVGVRVIHGGGSAASTKKNCREFIFGGLEENKWVIMKCKDDGSALQIENVENEAKLTLCELEIYVKEEYECDFPPASNVDKGYFEVSRSKAKLICEDGYKSINSRLVCENNIWEGNSPRCENEKNLDPTDYNEITCPSPNSPDGGYYFPKQSEFLMGDKITYNCTGGIILNGKKTNKCFSNGQWANPVPSCGEQKPKSRDRNEKNLDPTDYNEIIIGIAIGVSVAAIVILALIIYFVRRKRKIENDVVKERRKDRCTDSMLSAE